MSSEGDVTVSGAAAVGTTFDERVSVGIRPVDVQGPGLRSPSALIRASVRDVPAAACGDRRVSLG